MVKETDSDEDDIWNYKSAGKEKAQQNRQAVKANSFGNTSKVLRSKPRRKQKDVSQEKIKKLHSASGKGICTAMIPADTIKNKEAVVAADVIDVDLEPEDEFVSSKMHRIRNETNLSAAISQHNNLIERVTSGSINNTTKIKGRLSSNKKCSPTKMVTPKMVTGRSPRSTKASTSQDNSESLQYHNIHRYFSPTSEKMKNKRQSSESVDSLFDFTADEMIFLSEEKAENISEAGMKVSKLLKISNSQNHLSADTHYSVKSDSFTATIERSTTEQVAIVGPKNVISGACNSLITPQKDLTVEAAGSEHDLVTGDEIVNHVASPEDKSNVTARLDGSPDKCAESIFCNTSEGGFLVDRFACGLVSNIEGDGCRYRNEVHMSSSSESANCAQSLVSSECDIDLETLDALPYDKPNSFFDTSMNRNLVTEERDDANKSSFVQNSSSNLADKSMIMTTAQKQTTIFSFFKAKLGSSSTTKSLNNKFGVCSNLSPTSTGSNSLSEVTARPNLHRGKTVSTLSTTTYSLTEKSVSVPALLKQNVVGIKEPQQNNARNKRQCPFYKKIPNTGITVDAFSYGVIAECEAYILTHFHYDHYGGLTKRFAQPIYCSQVTGNLVEHRLGVHKKWINNLPLWKPCQVSGVTLTLMEANHCPGAVMILFELRDGRKMVHTGDFRATQDMEEYPMLKGVAISDLYLDTTYCSPSYTFPIQTEVINIAVSIALASVEKNPQTLIVCGTYTIGKEKIFVAIAKALNSKICVTRDKKKVLDCLEDKDLRSRVTLDWSQGNVHVLPMNKLNQKALFEHHACHPQFQNVLAFEPTGWTYSSKTSLDNISPKWSRNGVTLYGLPYSEHSSYLELKRFIQFLRPKKIIPTVNNGNPATRQKMEETFAQWMKESPGVHKVSTASSQQTKMNAWLS